MRGTNAGVRRPGKEASIMINVNDSLVKVSNGQWWQLGRQRHSSSTTNMSFCTIIPFGSMHDGDQPTNNSYYNIIVFNMWYMYALHLRWLACTGSPYPCGTAVPERMSIHINGTTTGSQVANHLPRRHCVNSSNLYTHVHINFMHEHAEG